MSTRKLRLLLPVVLIVMMQAPSAGALIAGNEAQVNVESPQSAVATCQVTILVNAIVILDVEDRLGLATGTPDEPVDILAPSATTFTGTHAECEVLVDKLRVVYPDEETARARAGSYVSGPAPVSDQARETAANAWRVRVTGEGSSAAVCQYLVLVSSVIIGGGAYGLPTADVPNVLVAPTEPWSDGARARCDARVGDVEVTHE